MPSSLDLSALLTSSFVQGSIMLPLFLIIADLLTGCLAAYRQGTFDWKKVANFVHRDSATWLYVGAALLVSAATFIADTFWGNQAGGIIATVFAVPSIASLTGKLVASISSNVSEIVHLPAQEVENELDQFIGQLPPAPEQDTMGIPAVAVSEQVPTFAN